MRGEGVEKETLLLLLLVGTPARGSFAINETECPPTGRCRGVVTVRVLLNCCRNGFLPRVRGAG